MRAVWGRADEESTAVDFDHYRKPRPRVGGNVHVQRQTVLAPHDGGRRTRWKRRLRTVRAGLYGLQCRRPRRDRRRWSPAQSTNRWSREWDAEIRRNAVRYETADRAVLGVHESAV